MVDEIINETEPQEEPAAEVAAEPEPAEAESVTDWKAQARKWEKRAKKSEAAQRTLEEELKGYRASSSDELDEMRKRAERAESRAAELQYEADRQTAIKEISTTEGVPAALLEHFETPEQMEAFAKTYKETGSDSTIPAAAPAWPGPRIVRDDRPHTPKETFVDWARGNI